MAPKFLQAEVDGRGRVGTRDRMGNTLTRVADAFEQTDTTTVRQLMGMPGWMEMAPMAAAAVGFNATAMSNLLPAPANPLDTENWTGGGPDWEKILTIVAAALALAALFVALAAAATLVVIAVAVLLGLALTGTLEVIIAILLVVALILGVFGGITALIFLPKLTWEEFLMALGLSIFMLPILISLIGIMLIVAKIILGGLTLVLLLSLVGAVFGFFIALIIAAIKTYRELFPLLFPDLAQTSSLTPTQLPAPTHTLTPSLSPSSI
jgi:hypothetical protein